MEIMALMRMCRWLVMHCRALFRNLGTSLLTLTLC
jgi:hypothetical protein